jgi:hypothetical protein
MAEYLLFVDKFISSTDKIAGAARCETFMRRGRKQTDPTALELSLSV